MKINSGYSHRNVTVFFLEKSDTVFYFFCILQKEGTKNKLSIHLCSALSLTASLGSGLLPLSSESVRMSVENKYNNSGKAGELSRLLSFCRTLPERELVQLATNKLIEKIQLSTGGKTALVWYTRA